MSAYLHTNKYEHVSPFSALSALLLFVLEMAWCLKSPPLWAAAHFNIFIFSQVSKSAAPDMWDHIRQASSLRFLITSSGSYFIGTRWCLLYCWFAWSWAVAHWGGQKLDWPSPCTLLYTRHVGKCGKIPATCTFKNGSNLTHCVLGV